MTPLQYEIIDGTKDIEEQMGNPYFTWQGNNYNFVPSVAEFARQLENGGFRIEKLLTGTVRLLNLDGSNTFTGAKPTAQQKIVYSIDGLTYRVEMVRNDPTGSYFRIKAMCESRGI
jgi:hypothetical protein